jgi:hypothetical protein
VPVSIPAAEDSGFALQGVLQSLAQRRGDHFSRPEQILLAEIFTSDNRLHLNIVTTRITKA